MVEGRLVKRDDLITLLACIVAGVWATSSFASIITQDYTSLSIVTPVMLIVAGFLFAARRNGNGRNGGNGK